MYTSVSRALKVAAILVAAALMAVPAFAADENPYAPKETDRAKSSPNVISHFRYHDARGINVFEAPKAEGVEYDGFKLQWGAAFTQQFQSLSHQNEQSPIPATDTLIKIGSGFNNAEANLYMDAQLARGIRVSLTSYLSSRHHQETWVKDGYLLVDGSPWENETLDNIMKYVTLRMGHFEINYGDMHFRRSDNGSAIFNPFVGNLPMDAFTTEIGGEVYVRKNEFLGMIAVMGGEVRGLVTKPESRSPSMVAKLGFDKTFEDGPRVRLTGSMYNTTKSINNTLYTGSRSGSRYYYVIEKLAATDTKDAWSGDVRPGFGREVQAWVINPFISYKGLELFGNIEQAEGRNLGETADRKFTQNAGELLYRFADNNLYVGGRYATAKGKYPGFANEATVNRTQIGGGWFLSQSLLAKIEYVKQEYKDFPTADIRHNAQFDGVMFEAVVSF